MNLKTYSKKMYINYIMYFINYNERIILFLAHLLKKKSIAKLFNAK